MDVGVLGVGRMGSIFSRILSAHPAVDRLLLAGSRPGRADLLAHDLEAEPCDDVDSLLGSCDAVVIASPTDTHPEVIRRSLDAGLPTFCEKPIALDLAATDAVIARAEQAGVLLQIGFHRRFDPGIAELRDAVDAGDAGRVYYVRSSSHDHEPSSDGFIARSGGIFRDLLVHDFDTIQFVTGQVIQEVFAFADGELVPEYRSQDDAGVTVVAATLSGGALATVVGMRHDPSGYDVRLEVHGSGGNLVTGWTPGTPVRPLGGEALRLAGPPHMAFDVRFADAYAREMGAFLEAARGRIPNPCPPHAARSAFVVAIAAEGSWREGGPVAIDDVDDVI
jgi:myo-inositol 2-dehydrogenase/D-chiro-inositol 1-dehydrogenase